MSIYNKVLAAANQKSMPTVWCQIFAQSLQKVESRLGITLDVVPRKDKDDNWCLWIIILPPSISRESSANLDIVGFDYHEYLEEFCLITVVGFRNYWYNERLYRKLRTNPNHIAAIENQYKGCHFDRQIRFNRISDTFYATIKSYNKLGDYLKDVGNNVFIRSLTPEDCIQKLNGLGVTEGDAIGKLDRRSKEHNWLEYLHIVSETPINCKLFLEQDPATIAEVERQIEQYLRGMILIDKIY